ncbi:MAG TPA: sugar ABC transporter permease [Ktedonobacterales bacterium]|nr:sugar ABC transporter permease [Ktedonobacterales bacterium]
MLQVKRSTIALYLLPLFTAVAIINLYPILYTFTLSFTNKSLFHLDDYHFVGVQNYQQALGSLQSDFLYVVLLTFLYVFVCVTLFLIVGMLTALALNNPRIKGLPFWRLALILPWAVPSPITALIWKFMFHYDFGTINKLLRLAFGPHAGIPWLTTSWGTFAAVVIINLWLSYPFFTVVILGALQSVPQELHEAASVDGANAWKRFRYITLPLLRPAITPATILSAITTFQMFNTVWLVNNGGPITSPLKPGFTSFVMIYIYNKLFGDTAGNPRYGAMAAVAVLIFVILLLMTIVSLRATNLTKEANA